MKRAIKAVAGLLATYVVLVLAMNGVAGVVQPELGVGAGEGLLRTFSPDGEIYERQLAVIDDDGILWLVSVQYFRRWYERLVENPGVELVREGEVRAYRAVPVDEESVASRIERLLIQRTGVMRFWMMRAGWLFAPIKAVRLDPV